jgi:hypothetical protein
VNGSKHCPNSILPKFFHDCNYDYSSL